MVFPRVPELGNLMRPFFFRRKEKKRRQRPLEGAVSSLFHLSPRLFSTARSSSEMSTSFFGPLVSCIPESQTWEEKQVHIFLFAY